MNSKKFFKKYSHQPWAKEYQFKKILNNQNPSKVKKFIEQNLQFDFAVEAKLLGLKKGLYGYKKDLKKFNGFLKNVLANSTYFPFVIEKPPLKKRKINFSYEFDSE